MVGYSFWNSYQDAKEDSQQFTEFGNTTYTSVYNKWEKVNWRSEGSRSEMLSGHQLYTGQASFSQVVWLQNQH